MIAHYKIDRALKVVSPQRLVNMLPLLLLGLLLATIVVDVFVQADQYGLTIDESVQEAYGRSVLAWYQTQGRDTSFLSAFPAQFYMPQHGAIFEVIVTEMQVLFGPSWHTRAVVNGLAGVVGVVAIALCGFELGGGWVAFLAAISLWLYPRFFGAMFNNSKDIPFAAAMTLVLWAVLVLIRQWKTKQKYIINSLNVGFYIGFAAAIRVTAILWYPLLIFILIGWWIHFGRDTFREKMQWVNLKKQAIAAAIIALVSFVTMIALWPYMALNPLYNLIDSIEVMSKFPWDGVVPFAGQIYPANGLPRSYAPAWLVIGSPPVLVLFTGIGVFITCSKFIKNKRIEPAPGVVCLALVFPLVLIIVLHPILYDSLRQFLFLVPPLILLSAYGFVCLFTYLVRKHQRLITAGLVLVVLVSQVQTIKSMYDLHPYEYMYFSPLVGGVPGANGHYEMDYWGICNKPAAEWLAQHYEEYTDKRSPTIAAPYIDQVIPYLPATFQATSSDPDFYISTTRFGSDTQFPSYKTIHTEGVQGYIACVVKAKVVALSGSG